MGIVQSLMETDVNTIVFSEELKNDCILELARQCNIECVSCLDSRSAVYMATGICAQNNEPIAVLVSSSNSRSAFSGMTEAYYRKLPVILITMGSELDYSAELKDAVSTHLVYCEKTEKQNLCDCYDMPLHIELPNYSVMQKKINVNKWGKCLSDILDDNYYLLVSQDMVIDTGAFKCKVVKSGLDNSLDGVLSNLLGASLANKRRRYIGIVSEREFLHDMNALGNINVNDKMLMFVVGSEKANLVEVYARSLGYCVYRIRYSNMNKDELSSILNNENKTVVIMEF